MIKLYGINLVKLKINTIVEADDLFEKHLDYLSEHRAKKVLQCKNEKAKVQELGAGLLLRYAFLQEGIDETCVTYGYSEHGKPFLVDYRNYFFNISHAGDYVICAISDGKIGCDIERIAACKLNVAKRFFSKKEYEQLMSLELDTDAQTNCFYRMWTFKESYLKMTGTGLAAGLKDIPDTQSECAYHRWYEQIPGYVASVCSENKKEILPEQILLIESLSELIS